jgi:hypothetical protein
MGFNSAFKGLIPSAGQKFVLDTEQRNCLNFEEGETLRSIERNTLYVLHLCEVRLIECLTNLKFPKQGPIIIQEKIFWKQAKNCEVEVTVKESGMF